MGNFMKIAFILVVYFLFLFFIYIKYKSPLSIERSCGCRTNIFERVKVYSWLSFKNNRLVIYINKMNIIEWNLVY